MFPQGYLFDKDHFTMKWLEEGLVGVPLDLTVLDFEFWDNHISRIIEEANMSFTEIINKNTFSLAAENCILNLVEDEPCQWQVNPLMLKFLTSKAAEKGLGFASTTLVSATSCLNTAQIAQRLALHHPDPQLAAMLQHMDLSHTRSLLITGAINQTTNPLDRVAYLVVLDLEGWENLKDGDMLQICKMFMLRYLSVRRTGISKLPPQIKELRILRALDVSCTHISELPSELRELQWLCMLDLRSTQIGQLPEHLGRLLDSLRILLIGGND